MAKSDYLENDLIKHVFRTGNMTAITEVNVALFTAAPSDSGGGTEVTGGNYARVLHGPSDATWDATSGIDGLTANTSVITFPVPSANWGTITHFALFDDTTNMLYWGALTTDKTVNDGDPAPTFPAGALTVTES
jgi:hypothetical protein